MIWLIWAHFGHDHPYCINDFMKPIHHRRVKRSAHESLESQGNVNAIYSCLWAEYTIIWSSNNLRNMVILMGKGPTEAKNGPIGWKGLKVNQFLFHILFFLFFKSHGRYVGQMEIGILKTTGLQWFPCVNSMSRTHANIYIDRPDCSSGSPSGASVLKIAPGNHLHYRRQRPQP